jgi:pyruvate/2-oxoglutarate dehydrogenase complex dihydrolipoamide acyltransferase (E2) component
MTSQGSTFDPIKLDLEAWPQKEYAAFVQELRQKLACLTTQRSEWYRGQHHASRWVTSARTLMVWLGTGGVLATAIAAGLRVYLAAHNSNGLYDIVAMGVALVLYASMAAVSFFERAAEGSGHYFRSILGILAIRDLWTAYQFKDAQMQVSLPVPLQDPTALEAAKQRWLDAARQYCTDLDAIATQELTEWRGAFQASITELSSAAKTGLAAAQTALGDAVKADAADAKTAAEEAKRAADAAKAAARPASLNLTIANTPGGEEAIVKIDDRIAAQGPERTFAVTNLTQGDHTLRVEVAAAAGGTPKSVAQVISLPGGITNLSVTPI